MRNLFARVAVVCLLLAFPLLVVAQSGVASLTGSVTDKSGAVVPNASVTLKNNGTNQTQTATTNAAGQYTFSRVSPGNYTLTVKAPNFSTTSIPNLQVFVGQTASKNVTLELGQVSQVVEVQGEQAAELQTQDASVGGVITGDELRSSPNLGHDATGLVLLQPGAMPLSGQGENSGGQIMGARSDQNTFILDGGDITNSTDGLGSYAGRNNFGGSPHGAVPTPVDSIEEFRVVTNNNIGGFNRSTGAEVQMVTRQGTNNWHGNLYDYLISDKTNAESWSLKHSQYLATLAGKKPNPNPEWRDNRFGGSIGGPIIHDKTFFFINVESHHYLQGASITRYTPTQDARNGTLWYRATDGTYKSVSLLALDPLGIGLNQDVAKIWSTMALPNTTGGDLGLNTVGGTQNFGNFNAASNTVTNSESVVGRLDHQITQNWHFMGSYRYGVEDNSVNVQTLMTTSGYKPTAGRPTWGNFAVFGLNGQITQHLTNDLHLNFTRLYWAWATMGAPPQLPGLGGALQIRNESNTSAAVPYNIDTQNARSRLWDGKDYNIVDTVSWLKGNHMISVDGRFGWQRFYHQRNDKVTGGLAQPIYYSYYSSSGNNHIGGIPYPADIASSNKTNFATAYVSELGIVASATQVLDRNGSLAPNPPGTPIQARDIVDNWQVGFNDAWKLAPSLTLSYGLTWSVELPPYQPSGTTTMMVDTSNGNKVFTVDQFLGAKAAAFGSGQYYNPIIGFMPIQKTGRKYAFNPDYGNIGPRLAVAWNPGFSDGIMGRIFGDHKTVVRAGWTRNFDRLNGVDLVMTPALGIGFADLSACVNPDTTGACSAKSGTTTPTTAFRIGTNGNSVSIPGLAPITAPVIPGTNTGVPGANTSFSSVDWHIDPNRKVGSTDAITLSFQRELPRNSMVEVGFVGRISRALYEKVDLNAVPYMWKMGGQTFANAFDSLQKIMVANGGPPPATLAGGVANPAYAAYINALPAQPFFNAALSPSYCSGNYPGTGGTAYTSCTAAVVDNEGGYISERAPAYLFGDIEGNWAVGNGSVTQFGQETYVFDTTASRGQARYAGLYATFKKGGKNLSYQFNYTYSKSLDSYGFNQDIIDVMADAYDSQRMYGPSLFDRRHVFNGWVNVNLPFGRGQRWLNSGGIFDRVVGGWGISTIIQAGTGVPNQLYDGNICGAEFGGSMYSYADCASLLPVKGVPGGLHMSRNNNPTISNGWGTNSQAPTGDPANAGYPNAFGNIGGVFGTNTPGAAGSPFRYPLFSDLRAGNQTWFYGMGFRDIDVSLSKTTRITERVAMKFSADLVNAFNHPNMADPSTDISSPASFGVMTGTQGSPRYIQWGLRFDF